MLSIGKLGVGQADYYLQAVGQGIEDYYAGTGEAPGRWLGAAATELTLAGEVDADQLRAVLNGSRPDNTGPLTRSGQGKSRVPGFDLTFSAPKSVSLLFGLGDEQISRVAREAHEAAVDAALEYLERHAALGRRGKGGHISVLGNGFIGAAFRHRTSRAGDPQLHTHVLVANMTRGPDGRWSALDARRLYTHARTGGFLYQAKLRLELTRRLGVEWTPVRNGVAEIDGIPAAVRRTFSRRRNEIEAELVQRGEHTAGAAQVAALHTRRGKDYDVPADQLRESWQARAAQLDFTPDHVTQTTRQTQIKPLTQHAADQGQEHLASPDGLTRRQSSFTRRDAVRAWCEQLPHGGDVHEIEALADQLLDSQAVVPLLPDASAAPVGDVVRSADGRIVASGSEGRRYSTPELLAHENEILDTTRDGRSRGRAAVTPATAATVLAAHPELSTEQATMVDRLLQDGDAIVVVVGRAGTGKTYALAAAREGWQAAGHQVIGAALARRASLELRDGAGINATSLHALLADLRDRPGELLDRPTVIVIDEAGMVGTRQLAELIRHATEHEAKVVLVGDPRQLPEIDAGGSFRALTMRGDPITLADNRRQSEQWERDALEHLRSGQADRALGRYAEHGRLTIADSAPQLREQLVTDWWHAREETGADAVMIALRRDDVSDLNARARAHMRHHDRLGPDTLTIAGKHFAVGDQAVCLRNHPGLGVTNGTHGTVTQIDAAAGTLVLTDRAGRDYTLTADYLASTTQRGGAVLDHGYALTGHKAQGITVDQAFVLGSDQLYREWGYVAMSRGRHANRLYLLNAHGDRDIAVAHADERRPPPLDAAARALARTAAQTSATDAALHASIVAQSTPALEERLTDTARDDAAARRRARRDRVLTDRETRQGRPAAAPESAPPAPSPERELIADELARRRSRDASAQTADPPRYLLDALGPVPEGLVAQRAWQTQAQRIENLRRVIGFSDAERALPDRAADEHRRELEELRRQLGHDEPARGVEPGRELGR